MRHIIAALALGAGVLAAAPAQAHKVVAAVYADGEAIEGEIGFSNGDMAANVTVEVRDEAGNRLGEATTDADGVFSFRPSQAVPHVFHADLGGGHVVTVTMAAGDLPRSLSGAPAAPVPVAATDLSERQRAEIAEAVSREIRPLRREIAAYREKNDLQSILGGVGYILGLFGIGFYVAARHRYGKA